MSIRTPAPARTQSPPPRGLAGLAALAATLLTVLTALTAFAVVVALLLAPLLLLAIGLVAYPLLRARERAADRGRSTPSAPPTPSQPAVPAHRFGSGAW